MKNKLLTLFCSSMLVFISFNTTANPGIGGLGDSDGGIDYHYSCFIWAGPGNLPNILYSGVTAFENLNAELARCLSSGGTHLLQGPV